MLGAPVSALADAPIVGAIGIHGHTAIGWHYGSECERLVSVRQLNASAMLNLYALGPLG